METEELNLYCARCEKKLDVEPKEIIWTKERKEGGEFILVKMCDCMPKQRVNPVTQIPWAEMLQQDRSRLTKDVMERYPKFGLAFVIHAINQLEQLTWDEEDGFLPGLYGVAVGHQVQGVRYWLEGHLTQMQIPGG